MDETETQHEYPPQNKESSSLRYGEAIHLAESLGSLPVGYTFTVSIADTRHIIKTACRVLGGTQHELRLVCNEPFTTTITKVLRTTIKEGDRKAEVGRLFDGETLTLPTREALKIYQSARFYRSKIAEGGLSSGHYKQVHSIHRRDGMVTLYVDSLFPPYAETQNP